ncbi:hypothetical protein SRHO_G00126420 [Serrasalmus rhombeus]
MHTECGIVGRLEGSRLRERGIVGRLKACDCLFWRRSGSEDVRRALSPTLYVRGERKYTKNKASLRSLKRQFKAGSTHARQSRDPPSTTETHLS